MHMADALLSPGVGAAMCAVSAGAMIYSGVKMKGGKEAPDDGGVRRVCVCGAND